MRRVWCKRPGWRTWRRQWWSPVCLPKPGSKKKHHSIKLCRTTTYFSLCFSSPSHLRELAVSKPLQPPHAVTGLPFTSSPPCHHDARPPGKALDLPPHQLTDPKTFVVLKVNKAGERILNWWFSEILECTVAKEREEVWFKISFGEKSDTAKHFRQRRRENILGETWICLNVMLEWQKNSFGDKKMVLYPRKM